MSGSGVPTVVMYSNDDNSLAVGMGLCVRFLGSNLCGSATRQCCKPGLSMTPKFICKYERDERGRREEKNCRKGRKRS